MKRIILDGIVCDPFDVKKKGETAAILSSLPCSHSVVPSSITIIKRSIDARKKNSVIWRYRIACDVEDAAAAELLKDGAEEYIPDTVEIITKKQTGASVIVVGTGPAGLFCALRLAAYGIHVSVIERGKPVEERHADIEKIRREGMLDPESNVLFGEGGAGTYSDGKLTTRIHKPHIEWVFARLAEHGAPPEILYDAKPHVGTDILSAVVASMRKQLIADGHSVFFGEKMTGLIVKNGEVKGIRCSSGREYFADAVVCATGHSARDTYDMLQTEGVRMEKKGFAAGMRIEHPAEFINRAQYGNFSECMPAADYRLTYNDEKTKRGVYSFCMCPGGEVVNSSSEPGMLCVNGMSRNRRDLPRSNAAIVVSIHPEDIAGGPMDAVAFQRSIERRAYDMGGGGFMSPAQSAADFIAGKESLRIPESISYMPGCAPGRLDRLYPEWMTMPLKNGLRQFDRMIRGFCQEGILIGAETRTSSPVRIVRDESMQSVSVKRLYPAGEGAGYAGGIVSSAVDGIRCAEAIASSLI